MEDKQNPAAGQSNVGLGARKQPDPTRVNAGALPTSTGSATSASSNRAAAEGSDRSVADQAKQTVSNVASRAGDKVASRLDRQKDKAAEGLGSVAQALRQSSTELRQKDEQSGFHEYIGSAADQVDRLSNYVRSTDVKQMVRGVEQFARRQPALFVGGAFVLGLLGARFLKSSSADAGSSGSGSPPRPEPMSPGTSYAQRSYGPSYSGAERARTTAEYHGETTTPGLRGEDF